MNAKKYAVHFCWGLMMLSVFVAPWITHPEVPKNQIMAAVALVSCFLYPFSKLALESLITKLAGEEIWKSKSFTDHPVGNNKIVALFWAFSFIFAIPVCFLALFFMKK